MSVELDTYHEHGTTYLAVGFVMSLDYDYYVERADGEKRRFDTRDEAMEFLSEGLRPPAKYTLEN